MSFLDVVSHRPLPKSAIAAATAIATTTATAAASTTITAPLLLLLRLLLVLLLLLLVVLLLLPQVCKPPSVWRYFTAPGPSLGASGFGFSAHGS